MSEEKKFRTMDWIIGTATTVTLLVGAWTLTTASQNHERIAVIEDSRFTREDAAEMSMKIKQDLAEPPRWVDEKFDALERAIEALTRELRGRD